MNSNCFMVMKPCPVCGKSSRVLKTKSRLLVQKTDEDFCVHYRDFNPYFYKIWVCEHCGFAADEKAFMTKLTDRTQDKMKKYLEENKPDIGFIDERTAEDAIKTFELAIEQMEVIGAPLSKKASTHLQLAWIYRELENKELEEEHMIKAAELFDQSITQERYPVGNLTDNGAMYLVGAIYYRLGDYEKCAQHLSRIIGDQSIRTREPQMFDKARNLWSDVRDIQKKQAAENK